MNLDGKLSMDLCFDEMVQLGLLEETPSTISKSIFEYHPPKGTLIYIYVKLGNPSITDDVIDYCLGVRSDDQVSVKLLGASNVQMSVPKDEKFTVAIFRQVGEATLIR